MKQSRLTKDEDFRKDDEGSSGVGSIARLSDRFVSRKSRTPLTFISPLKHAPPQPDLHFDRLRCIAPTITTTTPFASPNNCRKHQAHPVLLTMLHSGMPSHVFSHQHQQHAPFAFHDHQQHPQQHSNIQQYNRLGAASNVAPTPSTMLSGGPVGPDQRQHMNGNMGAGAGAMGGGIGAGGMGVGGDHGAGGGMSEDDRKTMEWIVQLLNSQTRETALLELSKKREAVPELALVLWHSFGMISNDRLNGTGTGTNCLSNIGVMTSLLQEIISVYPLLNPSQLTAAASNRVCNALALLQCVASHPETRQLFLSGTFFALFLPSPHSNNEYSTYPAFPVSLSQYHLEVTALRIPPPHLPRCNRRTR
jgi:hypothetical protein